MKNKMFGSIRYAWVFGLMLLATYSIQAQRSNSGKEDMKLKKEYANDDEFKNDIHEKFARIEKMNSKIQEKGDQVAKMNPSLKDEIDQLKTKIASFRAHLNSYNVKAASYSKDEKKAEIEKLKSEYQQVTDLFHAVREQVEAMKGSNDKSPKMKGDKTPKTKSDTKDDKMN